MRYGGKLVLGLGVLGTCILTLLTPLAARGSIYWLIVVRVLEGVGEVRCFEWFVIKAPKLQMFHSSIKPLPSIIFLKFRSDLQICVRLYDFCLPLARENHQILFKCLRKLVLLPSSIFDLA